MNSLIEFLILFFSPFLGSFASVVIYRLHHEEAGILNGRSKCTHCKKKLKELSMVPIFSYLWQKGRCTFCHQKISPIYFMIELSFLLTTFLLINFLPFDINFWWIVIISYILLTIFWYDVWFMEIDTRIIYPLSILIFIWKFSTEQIPIDNLQIISLLFLSVFTGWAFFAIQYFLTKKRGIGKGDLYLGIIMGLIFSWEILLLTIFLAYLIGTLVIIFLFIFKGKSVLKSKLPLGAFLVPATVFSLIFPQQILYIYSLLLI